MKTNTRVAWAVMLAATLVACDQAPEQGTSVTTDAQQEEVAELMARSAEYAGEAADETDDCGSLAYLMAVMPSRASLAGMTETYRGCESPVTANLQYESDRQQLSYTLSILDAELAELPEGAAYWQSILDVNRESMVSLMQAHRSLADAEQEDSVALTLADGSEAVIFPENGDWSLLAMPQSRYALRLDLASADREAAIQLLTEAAAALTLDQLR